MESTRRITEYLDLDLAAERWRCNRCGAEVHPPLVEVTAYSFAPDRNWCRIVEFYCPRCAVLIEVEYLPPGHPLTHDIELDIDALQARHTP